MKSKEDRAKSLERVQKLLKLSGSSVEAEARTAAMTACKIIIENNFIVVDPESVTSRQIPTPRQTPYQPYRSASGATWSADSGVPFDNFVDVVMKARVRENVKQRVPDPPIDATDDVEIVKFTVQEKEDIYKRIKAHDYYNPVRTGSVFKMLNISVKALKLLLKSRIQTDSVDLYHLSYKVIETKVGGRFFIQTNEYQVLMSPYAIPCGVCSTIISDKAIHHRSAWLHPFCAGMGMDIFEGREPDNRTEIKEKTAKKVYVEPEDKGVPVENIKDMNMEEPEKDGTEDAQNKSE